MDPSELHPALTPDRLERLGAVILQARRSAFEDHFPRKGDDAWSYGCTCYSRTKYLISQRAGTRGFEWLTVISERPEFIVSVDGVPLKFYKGEPDDPPLRAFQRRPREFDALQLEFEHMPSTASQEVLRLIVVVGADLRVDSLWLLRLTVDGAIEDQYELELPSSDVRSFEDPKPGVDLPKPIVRSRNDEAGHDDEEQQTG